jgi:hypothetical protein
MLFGFASFAGLPFSTSGPPVTYVTVTGNALTLGTGSVTITGDVNITAVKNALAISIGSATITGDVNVTAAANALTLATGIAQALTWSEISPGATMVWTPVDTT